MKKRNFIPRREKQHTSEEVRDELLRFIEQKFYPEDGLSFIKDQPRLLKWVVLKFAAYLDSRGVTVTSERYLQIVRDEILMEAVRHGNTAAIQYRPGWLGKVVDSHLAVHGEEYYNEGKSARDVVGGVMKSVAVGQARDPVRELAAASRLLKAKKRPASKAKNTQQLTLLDG